MPYKNQGNANIGQQTHGYAQNNINRENQMNDFASNYEVPSQLESAVLHKAQVHGGSGYAAATVADLAWSRLGARWEPGGNQIGCGKNYRGGGRAVCCGQGACASTQHGAARPTGHVWRRPVEP